MVRTIPFTHLKFTMKWLLVFTELCIHHHSQILNIFISPWWNPVPMSSHFLCSSPLSMAISNSLCFLWLCLFWTFHTSAFCDWLLSLSIVFKVCLFGNIYQYFICFCCWVIFHCMDIPHFIYSFISQWIHYSVFGLFPLFQGVSWWLRGKESTCQCRRYGFDPRVGKIPWRRKRQPGVPAWKIPGRGALEATVLGFQKSR